MTEVQSPPILIVEDRDSLRRLLERALEQGGYETVAVANVEQAVAALDQSAFGLVLTDFRLPDATGLDVVKASKQAQPNTPVVVMTAFGSVATAVEVMKEGASDFLEKPVEVDDLLALADSYLNRHSGVEEGGLALFEVPLGGPTIVGRHPRLKASLRLLERVATTDSTVLLTGESGTGKELFARAVHGLSSRGAGPFVAVNCAAIPASLIENELFGHEKGAFTGANRRQAGRFEQAEGGTLLLDEIGELELSVQAKVLRVLEDRVFQRVGSGRDLVADVRLVAATNRDLETMVEEGRFRSDLFFRLNVFPIELPALRDRSSDVPLIARYLLDRLAGRHQRAVPRLATSAAELLSEQPWPGNVRQLANVLERALILCDGDTLRASELEPILEPLAARDDRKVLCQALDDSNGDKKRAAELLGVSYRTLLRRVKEHGLEGYPHYHRTGS
jgi:DNA-binding NtrC family response regulator